MRLGYLVPEFPAQTHSFFWREISMLRRLGAEVHLLSTRRPEAVSRHPFAAAAARETTYLFPPRWGRAALYLALRPLLVWRMLRYIASVEATSLSERARLVGMMASAAELLLYAEGHQLDHVHGHSCANAAHLLALAAQSGRLPFSLTLHGDLEVYGSGHRAKFAAADFIACVTFALQAQVQERLGIALEKLPMIRMGVETDAFHGGERAADGAFRLVTVARLAECKGHIYALQAMRLASDEGLVLDYTIVGEGEERPAIEAEIARLGLGARVRLTGTAGEPEVLAALRQADCFVLPSIGKGEAAPVSVMEAMACGLPVIASRIGGTPEMIAPERNGLLVEQGDVQGLKAAFLRLGTDPALRHRLAAAARQTAVDSFSASKFAAQLLAAMKNRDRGQ